jgi:hypothetical protein
MGAVRTAEPTLPLAQARARWGEGVVVAGLFRPGPDPEARNAMTRAMTRRSNRRQFRLPARMLVAVDDGGLAFLCPVVADPQGGHPEGDDLYAGPFEELGAVAAGELSIVVLLDEGRPAVLEAVWLDHDAAAVAALLTGEPLPEELLDAAAAGLGKEQDGDDDDDEPSPEALLAEAEAFQARANTLRALAAIRQEDARDAENR